MVNTNFLGRGWGFPVRFFSPDAGPLMVEANEDIQQALKLLIFTAIGERPMRPDFGSEIQAYVFEALEADSMAQLQEHLRLTVEEQEPRIELEAVTIDSQEAGVLLIEISYTIRATNTRNNFVFPFYVNEAIV